MISSRAHAIVLALIVVPSATAGAAPKTCPRELAVTETSLLKTAIRLQTASRLSEGEKCAAYRTHADVVTKARQVFERCSTGRNRDQDIEQMDGALSQAFRYSRMSPNQARHLLIRPSPQWLSIIPSRSNQALQPFRRRKSTLTSRTTAIRRLITAEEARLGVDGGLGNLDMPATADGAPGSAIDDLAVPHQ